MPLCFPSLKRSLRIPQAYDMTHYICSTPSLPFCAGPAHEGFYICSKFLYSKFSISWKQFSVFNIACVHRWFSIFLDKNCHFVSLHLITCEFLLNIFIYSLAVVVHKWGISHHIHEYLAHLASVHACIPLALVQWWSDIDITIKPIPRAGLKSDE